jgi:hypothetical protein
MSIDESDGQLVASYNAASGGAAPMKANGSVGIAPRSKPGEFIATSNGVAVKVTLAEKGQVLIFSPDPSATGLGALMQFAGTARLDKKRTKAVVRYTLTTPLGSDSCMGSMAKAPPAQ